MKNDVNVEKNETQLEKRLVFTETLLDIYDTIKDIYENTNLPKFLRNIITKWMINKTVKTYSVELERTDLNYSIMRDFCRFYLNTIEKVDAAFKYANLHKGFTKVIANANFERFAFKKGKVKYDILLRDDGDIELTCTDSNDPIGTTSIIYMNRGNIDDRSIEKHIKNEMIIYIKYFLGTYCF